MNGKIQIEENLFYKYASNGDIKFEFDVMKFTKHPSESGMSTLVSSNHTNFRPFRDSNIQVRFNVFSYNPDLIKPKQDWKNYTNYLEIGGNLYFKYKDAHTIRVRFNPNVILYKSNTGKTNIIASNQANNYPFYQESLTARINIFTY